MKHLAPILTLAMAVTVGCMPSTSLDTREDTLLLEVAPETVGCVGEMSGQCIQVRTPGQDAWRTFYDPIDGFRYEPGFRYTLEVGRRVVPHPPADGSGYAYRLIRIMTKEPVGGAGP